MKKELLITFDYELFLGNNSGGVDECMIQPTDELLIILNKYKVHAIFFVDTTYLIKLKENSLEHSACSNDYKKVSSQIIKIINSGHFVFPHIHPHWLDAIYNQQSNTWSLNKIEKYRFHNTDIASRDLVFNHSIECLNDIIKPHFPNYLIDGFRAGGWCIQPFNDYKPYFIKHNIRYDFSVISGFYQFTDAQHFDFTTAPNKNKYRFSDDVNQEIENGQFHEFNISTMKISRILNLINKLWLKFYFKLSNDHTFNKGQGQKSNTISNSKPLNSKGIDLANESYERLAIELMTTIKLNSYIKFFNSNNYMHIISHPKMITKHNLKVFNKFLQAIFHNNTEIETEYNKMTIN